MAYYTPTVGIITNISAMNTQESAGAGCSLLYTVKTEDQGLANIVLPGNAYVLNGYQFRVGDRATFFYDPGAASVLIYPPQYRAVAAAYTPYGITATLDVFNSFLTNSDRTLTLNLPANPQVLLPNGQPFYGDLAGKLLLLTYGVTTKSNPAQTTPQTIVVFCSGV